MREDGELYFRLSSFLTTIISRRKWWLLLC